MLILVRLPDGGCLFLELHVDRHFAAIQTLKIVLLVRHLIIKTLSLGKRESLRHRLSPASRSSTPKAATAGPVGQALPVLLESGRCVQKIAKLGDHAAGEDAKNIPLMLCKL